MSSEPMTYDPSNSFDFKCAVMIASHLGISLNDAVAQINDNLTQQHRGY